MLLNDKQIAELAIDQNMIEPFLSEQIRKVNAPGLSEALGIPLKVISYGLSSFGYDIRVGTRFKIFTNVNCNVIDPKNFEPTLLVDKEVKPHEPILIPPNSFALAESLEYMRIPRDVMGICMGKSTYARCFSGDTRVTMDTGVAVSFKELCDISQQQGKLKGGIGIDTTTGFCRGTMLVAPRLVGERERLIRISLSNGEHICCTPDHEFLRHGKYYTQARDLDRGDYLVTLNEQYQMRRRLKTKGFIKVQNVEKVKGRHPVYCATAPATGNFAVTSGNVIVRNCGTVVNVTPLEPEWPGRITIEISNTAPLPVKVYSCEGIMQVFFLRGDQPQISYKDRGGRYSNQKAITLPKV